MPLLDDSWRFGPNIDSPTLSEVFEILIRIFDIYLLSLTSFLLYSILVLAVFYYLHWPTSYGRESALNHLSRTTKSLLLVTAIFPILYVAMWIGTGTVTAGPTLPAGGIFGTPLEKRIIGPDPISASFEPLFSLLSTAFQSYLTGLTTLTLVALVFLGLLYYIGYFPSIPAGRTLNDRIYRAVVTTLGVLGIFPILYLSLWIGTRSQQAHHQLAADGVFGTTFEERFVGPTLRGSIEGVVSIFGNIIQTYQVTISFVFVSLTTFFMVLFVATRWPLNTDLGEQRDRLYRALLGLIGSLAFIPILSAISWLATGMTRPDESFTRVAPPVELPVEELFAGPEWHSTIRGIAATKDPVEGILVNAIRFQTDAYGIIGLVVLVFGIVVVGYVGKSTWFSSKLGHQSIQGGVIILIVVFLLPGLITSAAWIASGDAQGGSSYAQNMAGSPFHHQDDFSRCQPEGWETTEGTSGLDGYRDGDGCALNVNGVVVEEYDLTDANYDQGFVEIKTDDKMQVRIYDGGELAVDEEIGNDRRFDIPVTGVTRVEIEADRSEVDSITAGLKPLPDPYFVVELSPEKQNPILRNGIQANITVYNIGTTSTGKTIPVNMIANGSTYTGEVEAVSQTWEVEGLDGGQYRNFPVDFTSLIENRTVGEVEVIASTNLGDTVLRERGPDFDNFDREVLTIRYADLHGYLPSNRTVTGNQTLIETRAANEGTAFAEPTTAQFTIHDEESQLVRSRLLDIKTLQPNETDTHNLTHTFETPGVYNVSYNVSDSLFPEGTADNMSIDVVHGNLRGNIENLDDTSRIASETNFTINVTNTGNAPADPTTADVRLVNEAGTDVEQWSVDVPNLTAGETARFNLSTKLSSTDEYTVELDVDYPEFPIDTTDSKSITGIGPDPNVYIDSQNVRKGTETDITTTIQNEGTDYSEPSTATATLTGPNGTTINSTTLNVPGLDPDETYSTQLFPNSHTETGKYTVNVNLSTTFETGGSNATDRFFVVYANLGIDVSATNTSQLNESTATVEITNQGTTRSKQDTANLSLINSEGSESFNREITVPELSSGETNVYTLPISVDEPGTYTALATINARSASTPVNFTWPDLTTSISTTEPEPTDYSTDLTVTLTNNGTAVATTPTTQLELWNSTTNVSTDTIEFSSLEPGESVTKSVTESLPLVNSYYALSRAQDPDFPAGNIDTTQNITVQLPDLHGNIQAEDVERGEQVPTEITVVNNGFIQSNATSATIKIRNSTGATVNKTSISIQELAPGASKQFSSFTPTPPGAGEYVAHIDVATDHAPEDSTGMDNFTVRGSDLTASLTANTIHEETPLDIQSTITNDGVLPSESTSATVYIENGIGEVVEQTTVSVDSLDPDESKSYSLFDSPFDEPGEYTARIDVDAPDDETGSEATDTFEVVYVDLQGDIETTNTTTSNQTQLDLTILNAGTTTSDSIDATVRVWNETGGLVEVRDLSYGSLKGDNYITPSLTFTAPEAGTYTGQINVTDQGRPRLSKHNTTFQMSWPDLHTTVQTTETPVTSNSTMVDVTVENRGPATSEPTAADVRLYDNFGNILSSQTISVPEIESGSTYQTQAQINFSRPGTYSVGVDVSDPEFPRGNTDDTQQFTVKHGNLHSNIQFLDDTTVVGTNTTYSVRISNAGNDRTEATTATIAFKNDNGDVVQTRSIDVRSLDTNGQIYRRFDVEIDTAGVVTATVTAHDDEFPEGSKASDTIDVVAPDLKTEIEVSDTKLNSKTLVELTVTNQGSLQSSSTEANVTMYNQDGDQATFKKVDVPALDPGESTTIEYTQLIHEKCWKTEMSCAPGATITTGTYEAYANVLTEYAPEGSTDSTTFQVTEESDGNSD
jgi:hypothetical protein